MNLHLPLSEFARFIFPFPPFLDDDVKVIVRAMLVCLLICSLVQNETFRCVFFEFVFMSL